MHIIRKLVAVLALAGTCTTASAANDLVINSATPHPGETFILQVLGTGFTDIVVGGGFDLSFDSGALSLDSVTINTALWEWVPSGGTINNGTGTLTNASFNTFFNSPTGTFLAATLGFTAKGAGTSTVTLKPSQIFAFSNLDGANIPVNYGTGSVTVTAVPVPEPAAVATMLLGLGLLSLVRLRRV